MTLKQYIPVIIKHIPLLLALLLCAATGIIYQGKLSESDAALSEASARNQQLNEKNAVLQKSIDELIDEIENLNNTAQSSVGTKITSPAHVPEKAPSSLIDIYNPETYASGSDSKIDEMKKRFEGMLVIHYFLQKCQKSSAQDYFVILAALGQEMASVNAPGRLQYDILTAAKGSYQEIYAKSKCDDGSIPALEQQFKEYIQNLSQNALGQ